MALVSLVGQGLWLPAPFLIPNPARTASDALVLDSDEEELQFIGRVKIDGGGSKTFGTSGSKVSWLAGASNTFASGSTLRIGVKKASSVDTANGPPGRATIGAAAFDVYHDLVGGTDTISNTTWRDDAMSAGTPLTVTQGDLIAICLHLERVSGSPAIKVRGYTGNTLQLNGFPEITLVTSGPTYTTQSVLGNVLLTFDDGKLGWIDPSTIFSVGDAASGNVGNTNIFGNIFQVNYPCAIDMIVAGVNASAGTTNFTVGLWSTPLGTPALVEGVSFEGNYIGASSAARYHYAPLTQNRVLAANTDYLIGVQQDANNVTLTQFDVDDAAHFKPSGMGAECYAATSTAGATFAAINSGKRRYQIFARISQLDNGAGGASGGGPLFGGHVVH